MNNKIILQESNYKCPFCKNGYLYPTFISGIVGIFTGISKWRCNNCNGLLLINDLQENDSNYTEGEEK